MPSWFGTNALVSNYQQMSETSPGTDATSSPSVGWVQGLTASGRDELDAGAKPSGGFVAGTTDPDGTLDSTRGDAFRSANTYTGVFATGTWTFTFSVVGVTQGGSQGGNIVFRLLRSANADGSGATEITSGQVSGSAVTNLVGTQQNSAGTTASIPAFEVNNEYIFVQCAWNATTAGGMSTTDVVMRIGTTATRLVSPAISTPTFAQSNFRFRNDDGSEASATYKATAGTNISNVADTNVRLRFEVSSGTAAPMGGGAYQLQYSKNGGAYTNVNASSSNVRSSASANVADGAATTEQLAGAQAFNAGTFDEVDGAATGFTAATALNQQTELEYCFQVRGADVAVGDTLDFRLLRNGTVLNTYSVTPRITVNAVDTSIRVAFPTPATPPTTGTDLQEFRALVRKTGSGSNPSVAVHVRETGGSTNLATPIATQSVSDTTGVVVAGTWDVSVLGTATGADVEAYLVGTGAPGGTIEVGAIEWNAILDATAGDTVSLTGLATEESVGSSALTAVAGVSTLVLTGLATEESTGTLTPVGGAVTITLTGVSSEESVGTLTPVPQAATVTLTGLASEETVGTLAAVPQVSTLVLAGLSSEESVGTLTPVAASVTATLTGLSSEETVGTLTPVAGTATISLTGLASEESVGALTPSQGVQNIALTGLSSEESVGTLTAVAGVAAQALVGLSTEESVGTLTAVAGVATRSLTGLSSEETVGTLSATQVQGVLVRVAFDSPGGQLDTGADGQELRIFVRKSAGTGNPLCKVELAESGGSALAIVIPNTAVTTTDGVVLVGTWDAVLLSDPTGEGVEAIITGTPEEGGTATLEIGAIEWNASVIPVIEIGGVPTEETPGTLIAVAGAATAVLTGVSSEESLGTLTPAAGVVTVALTGLSSEESIGTLTTVAGAVTVAFVGLSSEESVGALTAAPQVATVSLTGLASEESVGTLTATAGVVTVALAGLSTEENVGTLTPAPQATAVALTGLSTEESVGTLTPTQGVQFISLTGVLSEEIPWENYPLVPSGTLVPIGFDVPGGYYGVIAVPGTATSILVGLASEESVGTLTAVPGVRTLALVGLSTEESVGALTPTQPFQGIQLTGVASEESVGTLTAVAGVRTLPLVGLSTEESVGTLTAAGPPVTLILTGLASEEAVGILSVIFVGEYVGRPHFELTNERKIGITVSVRKKPQVQLFSRDKPQPEIEVRRKPQPVVAVREKAEFTLSSF